MVEEYHDLYTLQRERMENDMKQLVAERDIWSSATYELALKVSSSGFTTHTSFLAKDSFSSFKICFFVLFCFERVLLTLLLRLEFSDVISAHCNL